MYIYIIIHVYIYAKHVYIYMQNLYDYLYLYVWSYRYRYTFVANIISICLYWKDTFVWSTDVAIFTKPCSPGREFRACGAEGFGGGWKLCRWSVGECPYMGMGQYLFSGMNIHLPAILGFTRYQGFDPSPYYCYSNLLVIFMINNIN